jgi:hypothetical protein
MFERLHLTPSMAVSITALVLAGAGGAYASGSTGSHHAPAAHAAKSSRGPRVPRGPRGPQGIQGPRGQQGQKGNTGSPGPTASAFASESGFSTDVTTSTSWTRTIALNDTEGPAVVDSGGLNTSFAGTAYVNAAVGLVVGDGDYGRCEVGVQGSQFGTGGPLYGGFTSVGVSSSWSAPAGNTGALEVPVVAAFPVTAGGSYDVRIYCITDGAGDATYQSGDLNVVASS